MTEKLLTAAGDFLTRGPFTARKLVVVLVLAVTGGLGVVVYEIETASFALDKYGRVATMLKDLESTSRSTNESIASSTALIADELEELLAGTGAPSALSVREHRIALALIVGLPWLVLSIVGIVEGVRREPDWQYGFFGCFALAVLLGAVAYVIPTEVHWFYRYVVFPFAVYSGLVGLFYAAGKEDVESEG